jgi:hypothetical protein
VAEEPVAELPAPLSSALLQPTRADATMLITKTIAKTFFIQNTS